MKSSKKNLDNEIDRDTHVYKKSTIINSNSDKPKADKSRHYVDGEAFYQALKERRTLKLAAAAIDAEPPAITNFIGECIMGIATNLAKKYQFANYPYKDEMIADAIVHSIRYIDSFDPEKSNNPFSYYTQACYYQFLARIGLEREQTYVKCKATLNSAVMSELSEGGEDNKESVEHIHDNFEFDTEFMDNFVGEYERKIAERKAKTKKKGLDLLEGDAT